MGSILLALLASAGAVSAAPAVTGKNISPPATVPAGAYGPIVADFAGWAIESTSLIAYAGPAGRPNKMSINLLNAVSSRTGISQPLIRMGGTSLDHATYDGAQKDAQVIPASQQGQNVPIGATFGPTFFDSFKNLNVQWVLDVPLAYNNLSNTIAFTKKAFSIIGKENIRSVEIGNEPNNYPGTNRPTTYGPTQYDSQWIHWSTAISKYIGGYDTYQIGTVSSPPINEWDAGSIVGPILQYRPRIASISYHYYQTNEGSDLQSALMNHTAVIDQMSQLTSSISWCHDHGLPLNMAEVGSSLNSQGNDYALESVLGSALWQVDFQLNAMASGVHRVNMQQGTGFGYAAWQPVTNNGTGPHVNAPYYAQVFIADWIGKSGQLKVNELAGNTDTLVAYAGYVNSQLAKLAIINLNLWTQSYSTSRPSVKWTVKVPSSVKTATVRYLTSPQGGQATAQQDISWDDTVWMHTGNSFPSGSKTTKQITVNNGQFEILSQASTAMMIDLA